MSCGVVESELLAEDTVRRRMQGAISYGCWTELDSNNELDRFLKPHKLLSLKVAEVVKKQGNGTKSVQNHFEQTSCLWCD